MKYKYTGPINIITIVINKTPYAVDLPKVDYSFVDDQQNRSRKMRELANLMNQKELPLASEMDACHHSVEESLKNIIEKILPGKWNELFEIFGHDFGEIERLVDYLYSELIAAGARSCRID